MAAFLDGCRFNPAAGGTANWTYSSAVNGYQSPAAANIANGRLYKYRAESADLSQWEFGEGAYNTTTGMLARTTILYNSSGTTSKINFSTVPQVAIVALKEDLISVEESNSFTSTQQAQARSNIGVSAVGAAAVGQIPGGNGVTAPAAGSVGEVLGTSGSVTFPGSAVAITVLSLTLTPGVWDLEAEMEYGGPGATSTFDFHGAISTAPSDFGSAIGIGSYFRWNFNPTDVSVNMVFTRRRIVATANKPMYLNAVATYSGVATGVSATFRATRAA